MPRGKSMHFLELVKQSYSNLEFFIRFEPLVSRAVARRGTSFDGGVGNRMREHGGHTRTMHHYEAIVERLHIYTNACMYLYFKGESAMV